MQHLEYLHQVALFQWASLQSCTIPELRLLNASLNGLRLPIGLAVKAKRVFLKQEFTNYPRNILEYSKEFKHHTSQKPVPLLEYLIKTYTLEGETVLDFTMGSGSTGVACKNLNRKFIGIEKDENYFNIAKNRIEAR